MRIMLWLVNKSEKSLTHFSQYDEMFGIYAVGTVPLFLTGLRQSPMNWPSFVSIYHGLRVA